MVNFSKEGALIESTITAVTVLDTFNSQYFVPWLLPTKMGMFLDNGSMTSGHGQRNL